MQLYNLPNELLYEILLNLDYNDLLKWALSCQKFNAIFKMCKAKLKKKFLKPITIFKPAIRTSPKLSTCFMYQYSEFPNGSLHGTYMIYKQVIENKCYYHHMLSYCKYRNGKKEGYEVKFTEDKVSSITRWKKGKKEGESIKYQYIIDDNNIYISSILKYNYSRDKLIDRKTVQYYDKMPRLDIGI